MDEKATFDQFGNSPALWLESAVCLLMSSAALKAQSHRLSDELEKVWGSRIPATRLLWPQIMIRAFATECLIKTYWLSSKKKLCVDGKYIGIVKREGHDLAKMARHAGINLCKGEEDLLKRLTAVATGIGRYPVHTSVDYLRKLAPQQKEPLRIEWCWPTDEQGFTGLLKRLWGMIGSKKSIGNLLDEA